MKYEVVIVDFESEDPEVYRSDERFSSIEEAQTDLINALENYLNEISDLEEVSDEDDETSGYFSLSFGSIFATYEDWRDEVMTQIDCNIRVIM
jgi:hypothetical protein